MQFFIHLQDMNILRDYIAYAKSVINPKISEAAGQAFIQEYVNMRKIGSGRGQVSAYPRQLESLIRLAEAHSKMRLSDTVEVADVEEAMRYVGFTSMPRFSKYYNFDILQKVKLKYM